MHAGLLANVTLFPAPTISLSAFLALVQAVVTAQQNTTTTKAKGLASLRNAKRDAVWTAMDALRAYIQGLADVGSAENAMSLIEAAGLLVAGSSAHTKALLQAKLTTTGVVHLIANASLLMGKSTSKRVTFFWQWSVDSGKTWNDVTATPYAQTDIPNLTLMTTYAFRVRVTIAKVAGEWSQSVSLLVH